MNIDFAYYRSIFWRRFPYFIVVASILTSIGLTTAMVLPSEYEARATLLVESAQIPDELASSTVNTATTEQLQIIEQRLMTRANLIDTAERLDVYKRQEGEPVNASAVVNDMRARTTFSASSGRDRATLMTITFRAPDPQTAAEVTNEFVTLVLQENVEMRTNVAGETLEFFEQEVDRLGGALDAQAAQIITFKNEAGRALPESEAFLVERMNTMADRIAQIDREIDQTEEQKTRIIDLFEQNGSIDPSAASPRQRALLAARDELDRALIVYAETSPRVRLLNARIAQLEERVRSEQIEGEAVASAVEKTPQELLLESQVGELDERIEDLQEESITLRENVAEIDLLLAQIPANGLALQALEREHDGIQKQFVRASDRLSAAETGERIELLSKGQRITIIEQALPPDRPTKPNRTLIAGAGAAAGVAFGLGVVVLLELLNRAIRRPAEIVDRLGITPIAVLPYLRTDAEIAWRRLLIILLLCGLVLVLPLTVYLIHSFVVPLDGVANSILQRFGLTLPVSLE